MAVRISGVSKLLQPIGRLYKAVRRLLPCYRSFEVKFWFPQFGGTGTPMEWAFVVSDGVSVTSYGPHYKALGVCYGLCTVFNLIFLTAPILGEEVPLRGRRLYRWVWSW